MGDIKVEAFDVSFTNDGTTSSITDVGSTSSAFVLNLTSRRTSGGWTGSSSNQNWDDFCAAVRLTDTDELTFYRPSAGTGEIRMMGEVWRYAGSGGGDHEFIKRWSGEVTIASGDSTANQAVSGVSDPDKVVCFVTGVEAGIASTGDGNRVISTARMTSSSNLQVERGETGTAVTVHVEVVEFTGSAWSIGFFDSGVIGSDNSATPTINDQYDYGGDTFTVSDWTTAFIWADMLGDTTGANHNLEDTWFVVENNNSTSVLITLDSTADVGRVRGYVIQNDDLSVERESGSKSIPAGLDTSLADPSNISTANERSIAESYCLTDGTGSAYARGAVTWKLNGDAVETWVHRSGNAGTYRYAGIDLSGLSGESAAYSLECDTQSYSASGANATVLHDKRVVPGTDSFAFSGTDVTFSKGRTVQAGAENFAFGGTAAGFGRSYVVGADSDNIALSGDDTALEVGYALTPSVENLGVSGVGATLMYGRALAVSPESIAFSGTNATFALGASFSCGVGDFSPYGMSADTLCGRLIVPSMGSFGTIGHGANLVYTEARGKVKHSLFNMRMGMEL